MRNVSDTWQLLRALGITKENKHKSLTRIVRPSLCSCVAPMRCSARGREALSVGWHGCLPLTLGDTLHTCTFLHWGQFSLLLNHIRRKFVYMSSKWCFLFWLFCFNSDSDLTEILPPPLLPPLCILLFLCCFLTGMRVCVSEAFREELVAYCFTSQAKSCNVRAKEHSLCPMKQGGKKEIVNRPSYLGDLNLISLQVWYWTCMKTFWKCFICPCFFPCQLIWNLLRYVIHQLARCAGITVRRRDWAC